MSHAHVQLEITGCSAPPSLARCVVLAVVTMTVSSSIVRRCVPPNGTNPGNDRLKQIIDGWIGLHSSGAAVVVQRVTAVTHAACCAVISGEVRPTPPSVCVCGACVVRKCRLSAGCSTLNCERPLRILPNKLLESLLPFYSSCICVIPRLIMSRDVAGCDCHDGLVKVYCVPELRSVSVTVTRHTREARHESNGHKRVFRILHRKMVLKQGIPFSLQAD